MRALISICLLIVMLVHTFANSYLFTLEQKVATCTAILKVSIAEITPPQTKIPNDPAICKATVTELLKGPADLKEVEFRFTPYRISPSAKLPVVVGTEYYVFLHEPPLPGRPSHERWVFEGPHGIRPIMDTYQEHRMVDAKVTTEMYSRTNYVARILELVKNAAGNATKGK